MIEKEHKNGYNEGFNNGLEIFKAIATLELENRLKEFEKGYKDALDAIEAINAI